MMGARAMAADKTARRQVPAEQLDASIASATRALIGLQNEDGHFVFELEADATIPAEYVLLRHHLAEPVDPEVETVRLDYRAQLARCFEGILREGIMRGVFPRFDPAVAAACIVGAFMEALVGPLAPAKGTGPRADRHLIEQITQFCLRANVGVPESKP